MRVVVQSQAGRRIWYWERMQAGRREAYALLERNQKTRTTQEREGYLRRYREGSLQILTCPLKRHRA